MTGFFLKDSHPPSGDDNDSLDSFLHFLDPDPEKAGILYEKLRKKLMDYFAARGIDDVEGAADETMDRAARKIAAGAEVPRVDNFCFGIARNLVKEYPRFNYQEQKAYTEFAAILAGASEAEAQRIAQVWKPCFEKLSQEDQELLTTYCQPLPRQALAQQRQQLADSRNLTLQRLRSQVMRLRATLHACAQKRQKEFLQNF